MQRREFIKSVLGSALLWKAPALLALQAAPQPPAPDPEVKRVLVMFKCHFDAGFIDTQAAVVHRYFTEYFPRAIDLAEPTAPVGRRSLCLDHRIMAALRISGAGDARGTRAHGKGHLRRRHRMACAPIHLADRVDGCSR